MEGRRWFPAMMVVVLAGGCGTLAGRRDLMAHGKSGNAAPLAVAKQEQEKKRLPKPETMVSWAIVREREAEKLNQNPTLQLELREQARRAYNVAISLDANHLPAYAGLARLYDQMEDYDKALETFHKTLERFPKEASLWYDLGMCHCRRKDWTQAIKALQKALDLDPENRQMMQTLGFTLARAGQIDESLVYFRRAVGPAQAHFNVARMLLHTQQVDACKQHLQMALQANPNFEGARQLLLALDNAQTANNLVSVGIQFESMPPVPGPGQ
jgi:tetratricopeptide (TPR) repeat protein